MTIARRAILILTVAALFPFALGADAASRTKEEIWQEIEPLFDPGAFEGEFGDYRSPLTFEDGSRVETPEEWEARRAEIREVWTDILGPWPDIIKDPEIEYLEETDEDDFVHHRIRFDHLPGEPAEANLLIPHGIGEPRPAVLTVFYDPDTAIGEGREYRDFALQLTKRGFVTLSIGYERGLENGTYSPYYPSKEDAQLQPLSALAYAAANAFHVLASRPEVDEDRIGITGHSYGGKWAMFASCLYEPFAGAAWSDGGIVFDESRSNVNYWENWYLGHVPGEWREPWTMPDEEHPRTGAYARLIEEGRDLHELHALMAPRPFLVSGGSEDPPKRWEALNHTVEVNRLLGYENRVAMSNRSTHSPTSESNEQLCSFFEWALLHGAALE
ncbi:MAG: alpha/beta hydrolase family protein [Candidatus Hydrogenedentota bacterium]